MNRNRRFFCIAATAIGAASITGLAFGKTLKPRVIKITAQKFRYMPNEIILKKSQPVILEFTALDFVHGFSLPDFKIRSDLPPGQVTRIKLTPTEEGTFAFLCDNFCGSGHEEMNGRIIVKG